MTALDDHVWGESRSVDQIWSLVVGFSPNLWDRKPICMLQAYIDDSRDGLGSDVLVLAGYIAPASVWANFSREWQELLSMAPMWPSFKMSEIARAGGEERWERAEWFYRAIERHVHAAIVCAVDKKMLVRVADCLGLGRDSKNPYFLAAKGVINITAQEHEWLGFAQGDSVDFIFDEQSEKGKIVEAWDRYLATVSEEVLSVTGKTPIFRDDEQVLPLQAADMYAWWCRKRWQEAGTILDGNSLPFGWEAKRDIRRLVMQPNEEDMYAYLRPVRDWLDSQGRT